MQVSELMHTLYEYVIPNSAGGGGVLIFIDVDAVTPDVGSNYSDKICMYMKVYFYP